MAEKKQSGTKGRKAGKTAVPENESKADRFRRLANMRVPKALKAITVIGNLSGSGYESTKEQREAITSALGKAVESLKQKLDGIAPATEQFKI